jgi:endonuclease/exonuclease/phosphatase (EEP) superfamily protein YafD
VRVGRVFFWLAAAAVAAPAVALTLTRLADPVSGPGVRTVSFTPMAVPFYVADVLVVGVAVAAGWGGPRKVTGVVLAGLVAGLGLHVWWLSPQFVGDTPAAAADATPLVIMNANLYAGGADVAEVVEVAAENDVDVLILEEITFGGLERMEAAGLADLLPYRIGSPNGAVDGTMVFSRQPLGEPARLDTLFQSWQVEVGESGSAGSVQLLAVHPQAPVPPAGPDVWRAEHAAVLEAAEEYDADLVVGDMNATADHRPIRDLRDGGWKDANDIANAGWMPTWPANGITPAPGLSPPTLIQIDHILVGPRLTVLDTKSVEISGSDHRALIATVALR